MSSRRHHGKRNRTVHAIPKHPESDRAYLEPEYSDQSSGVRLAMLGGFIAGKAGAERPEEDPTARSSLLDTVYSAMTSERMSVDDRALVMAYAGNLIVQAEIAVELLHQYEEQGVPMTERNTIYEAAL